MLLPSNTYNTGQMLLPSNTSGQMLLPSNTYNTGQMLLPSNTYNTVFKTGQLTTKQTGSFMKRDQYILHRQVKARRGGDHWGKQIMEKKKREKSTFPLQKKKATLGQTNLLHFPAPWPPPHPPIRPTPTGWPPAQDPHQRPLRVPKIWSAQL